MAISAFDDKSRPPGDEDVKRVLGSSAAHWAALQRRLALTPVWGFTAKSTGWGLRLKKGERIIVYLTPQAGQFRASFALGERAVAAARTSALPKETIALIETAKKYVEGRAVRIIVKTAADARVVEQLAAIKIAN